MSIEFHCVRCGRLLRTGDETAGRQAQCPECGALTQIPAPAETSEMPPLLGPLGGPEAASSAESPGDPFGPTSTGSADVYGVLAAKCVSGPATALMVTAGITFALHSLVIVAHLAQMAVGPLMVLRRHDVFPAMYGNGVQVVLGLVGLVFCALVFYGAAKMKALENYSLAMTVAILAIIPCTSPCCLLGMPFGIWALVVLCDSSVKAAFRS